MKKQFLLFVLILIWGCGPDPIPSPEPTILISPENLNSCTTATPINDFESQVRFQWTAALNSETYELVIQNTLSNNQIKRSSSLLTESVALPSGVPYSWYVNSKSILTSDIGKSEVWYFYLEGDQQKSTIPFPAVLMQPENNTTVSLDSNGSVTLSWEGNDLDQDIIGYDLYLGSNIGSLVLEQDGLSVNQALLNLDSNTKYFWQIVTYDSENNSSSSLVFNFQTTD